MIDFHGAVATSPTFRVSLFTVVRLASGACDWSTPAAPGAARSHLAADAETIDDVTLQTAYQRAGLGACGPGGVGGGVNRRGGARDRDEAGGEGGLHRTYLQK